MMSLGPIGKLPAVKVRAMAIELLAKARLGQDPASEKRKARDEAGDTFGGEHLKHYLVFKQKGVKARSFEEIQRHLISHAASLHPRLIRQIDRKLAATLLAGIADKSGDWAADAVRTSINAYFGWLMSEGHADANPFIGTTKRVNGNGRGKGRTRVPTPAELVEIWNATDDGSDYEDPELASIRELFSLWPDYLDLDRPYTTNRIVELACETPAPDDFNRQPLKTLLLQVAGDHGGIISTRRLGQWLRRISGRVVDKHRLILSHPNKALAAFRLSKVV
jgi:hypothetical protein